MRTRCCLITFVAIALLGPPAATAAEPGVAAAQSGPKDYSKNSATGDYVPDLRLRMGTSSLAGTTSASASGALGSSPSGVLATGRAPAVPVGDDGTPWDALASGLLGVCLGAGGVAIAGRTRRRTRHASAAA